LLVVVALGDESQGLVDLLLEVRLIDLLVVLEGFGCIPELDDELRSFDVVPDLIEGVVVNATAWYELRLGIEFEEDDLVVQRARVVDREVLSEAVVVVVAVTMVCIGLDVNCCPMR
jgi:hypothetical protein